MQLLPVLVAGYFFIPYGIRIEDLMGPWMNFKAVLDLLVLHILVDEDEGHCFPFLHLK